MGRGSRRGGEEGGGRGSPVFSAMMSGSRSGCSLSHLVLCRVVSRQWVWPLGCGFLLPSTSGGNSVYYLRASVLFSHGSQQARGLGIAAATLNPGPRKFMKKINQSQSNLCCFLLPHTELGVILMYNFVKVKGYKMSSHL